MKKLFFLTIAIIACNCLFAQINLKDSTVSANIVNIDLGVGMPAADMADRFGNHMCVGGGWQFKTQKNFLFGINGDYIFGSTVHDDSILNVIKNTAGYAVGIDGAQYTPILNEQALDIKLQFGQITPLFGVNPNSGLTWLVGAGYMQHNILIYIDEAYVPQLAGDYKKGYDRYSNGFMLNQYLGYYLFSNKHFVDFRAGVEINEAFTKNRRNYNYDTQAIDDATRLDMTVSLKLGWNLTIFEKPKRRFYK